MKFRAPTFRPAAGTPVAGRSRGTPDWLKEWLEKRGQYVKLSCGHLEDLNYGALLIIARFGLHKGRSVMCEQCNIWVDVTAPITMHEYYAHRYGITPSSTIPDEPLF